jgi:hypothetical protein
MGILCFQASQEPGGGKWGSLWQKKRKITGQFAPWYRKADKAGKTKILDEYLALAGGNRKYAIFKLGREGKQQLCLSVGSYVNVRVSSGKRRKRVYTRYYDDAVKKVLVKLWGFFRRVCGERLTPLIKANLDALCRRKRFGITDELRDAITHEKSNQDGGGTG